MSDISKQILFGDALGDLDIGGLNMAEFGIDNLIERAQNNAGDGGDDNNNNDNIEDINYDISSDEDSGNNKDENELGIDVICHDDNGKIFKFTDLIIPLDDKSIQSTEKFLRKKMEKIKKDKNDKSENIDIKKREKNEEEEISKLIKLSKKCQKYVKFNIGYDEKFFDKTLFTKKQNNDNDNRRKSSDNKMNIEEEKNNQEIKNDINMKNNIDCNYDDLIKNTLLQFDKHYYIENNNLNNNNTNNNEKKIEKEKEIKLEDEMTKDFRNKIFERINQNNIFNNNIMQEEKKDGNDIIDEFKKNEKEFFFGENTFLDFSKKNSEVFSDIFSRIKIAIIVYIL